MLHGGGNRFLKHITDDAAGHSEGNERQLLGKDRYPVPMCKAFVRMLSCSWLCIVCLRVCNRILLTALPKLMKLESSLHSQRFLCRLGLESNPRPPSRQTHILPTRPLRLKYIHYISYDALIY